MISKPCKRDGFSDSRTFPFNKGYCFREELLTYLNSHSELSETSKMELFTKIVNGFHLSIIFGKGSILVLGRVLNTFLIILIIIIPRT